ncbi:hypothetical protein EUGRSUZ_I01886 [Eucalyptus grandis]|uniref:Uncharacterized protein n=2 Tax=Eucalyptus grandis TaxID=71139 RepID=A0ACC3JHH1_EUCGR|nr:hypothetical protein EUGRSUZ_I01886 [Eucalyptus grandis]
MRARYLRAVLRQDVTYFDMHVMSTSDIITSVSSNSLVIQDVLSEKSKTLSEFSKALEGSVKLGLRQGSAKGLAIRNNSIVFAILSFMAYYGSRMVIYHHYKGGTVYVVGTAITFGGVAFGTALSNLKYFSEACSAGERIEEVIKRVPPIDPENMEGQTMPNLEGNIEFRHIEFAYPSRPENIIFRDFSVMILSGKSLALVGGSGSGKSRRFYDPLSGQILLDGFAINKMQIKRLRSQMGLMSQEPTLFATSIKENILFGKKNAEMKEVIEAAKASNAHNFINEATSALDSEWEKIVQDALDRASIGRTTIIIAHRLSTIRHANNIAVVQNGQVIETGNHEELIQNEDGLYASLKSEKQKPTDQVEKPENQITSSIFSMDGYSTSSRHSPSKVSRSSSARSMTVVGSDVQKTPIPSFRRLIALNLPEWKQAILGCISAILFSAVQPVYSFAMGSMISVYFLKDHEEIKAKIRIYAFWFLGLAVFSLAVNVSQHYNFAFMGEYLTKRIRERMLSKILTFEVGWFNQEENSSGSACSRLANDANVSSISSKCCIDGQCCFDTSVQMRSLVGDRMALIVQTCSAIIVAFAMDLIITWRLALMVIAAQPLIIVSFYTRRVQLKTMSQKAIEAQEESSRLAGEAVSNHRTIPSFSSQACTLKMLEKARQGQERESIRKSWYAGIGLASSQFFTKCTWALDFWYGGKLISHGQITSKALFETFMILISTSMVIADAGSMTTDMAKGSVTVASMFAILNRPDVIVLKDFSFKIKAGKSTALVGQSGSGKSTPIGLIERTLRKHIALVSQEPTLFAGTIRENIVHGISHEMSETEIIEAARAANAHDFILALTDGYDTWCGEKGVQLSGGQKQRVAIARAILRNPTRLLLDEATSALDSQSEKVVQNALEQSMVGRTTLVVAHRLSTN